MIDLLISSWIDVPRPPATEFVVACVSFLFEVFDDLRLELHVHEDVDVTVPGNDAVVAVRAQ